jgi:hypothetical protein
MTSIILLMGRTDGDHLDLQTVVIAIALVVLALCLIAFLFAVPLMDRLGVRGDQRRRSRLRRRPRSAGSPIHPRWINRRAGERAGTAAGVDFSHGHARRFGAFNNSSAELTSVIGQAIEKT